MVEKQSQSKDKTDREVAFSQSKWRCTPASLMGQLEALVQRPSLCLGEDNYLSICASP